MRTDAFRCADSSDARAEPLYGTASFVRRWLLLEQPGSWGRDALTQSRLPQAFAGELRNRAVAAGVRVILIRRGVRFSSDRRHCYLIRTEGCDLYQAHLALDDLDDLLDVDLGLLQQGAAIPDAMERSDPIFLVCTHGRHDACCSIRGNQVSRIACALPGANAWECSHIGGDRFAANLVCFPHGLYYGRVGADDVASLMEDYSNGTLSLDHYRGRCCHPFPVQAAEYFARREASMTNIDAVSLMGAAATSAGVAAAFSIGADRRAEVQVRVTESSRQRLTCGAAAATPIPVYDLVSCTISDV